MDKELQSVFLSFGLYCLYVLLPMIPAILIYRLFPDTQVSLKGPLSKLTMKTTGAFAAYVVTVILGAYLVKNTLDIINAMAQPGELTWTVKAEVELRDKENHQIDNPDMLSLIQVSIQPEITSKTGRIVQLKLPRDKEEKWPHNLITFSIPQFGSEPRDLSTLSTPDVEIDKSHRVFRIVKPVIIKKVPEYAGTGILPPTSLPPGSPKPPQG